jgi:hypothetical protein
MTTRLIARCSIYEQRPDMCKKYPLIDSWVPPECTFYFAGEERKGKCACDVGACCAEPREKGEPIGAPLPAIAGGVPCKYLVTEEAPVEKTAAHSPFPIVQDDEISRGDLLREAVIGE